MQQGDDAPENRPFLHWPSLTHPAAQAYLPLPVPAPPTQSYLRRANGGQGEAMADSNVLPGLITALQGVDVSYLRPLRPAPPGAGEPRTILQKQVDEQAPGIFASAAPPVPATAAPNDHQAVAPNMAPPPAQQPGGAGPVPVAAQVPRRAADKPPAAKRARVAHVAVAADRMQQEMPAEEAAKAAEAYTAFIAEFVRKHDKQAVRDDDGGAGEGQDEDMEGSQGEGDDGDDLLPSTSSSAGAALLRDVRRLCKETLRICRADHLAALRGVAVDALLSLLRLLHRLVKAGAGRLLEQGDAEATPRAQAILVAVEASATALHIMTVPNMPQRVYNGDVMEAILDLMRFQLTYNVYPFHEPRLRASARPKLAAAAYEDAAIAAAAEAEAAAGTGKRKQSAKKAKSVAAAGVKIPPVIRPLLDRCQTVLLLLADLLRLVKLPAAALMPLLRACMVSLAVEGQKLLQEKAVRLLVAAFRVYPAQWGTLLDELFAHVIPHLPGGPRANRDFPASEDARTCIQMLTAAVLQMIQGCVDLPPLDCDPASLAHCYKGAATCADYLWTLCFDRLPSARAHKSETDMDFRHLLSSLLRDLLAVAHQPCWPAAPFLLLRFAALLQGDRGLRHSDAHVRQHCIDLLASLATQLYADEVEVQKDGEMLKQLVQEEGGSGDLAEEAPRLLLLYLADRRRGGHASAAAARTFMLCQAFAEEVTNLQKREAPAEQLVEKLVQYRRKRDELDGLAADVELDAEQAQRLMRFWVQLGLGRARSSMVQWLLECLNPATQASMTRSKAVKALGEVVQVDTRVLESASVQAAVDRALQDESVSVREAAVSLLGRHVAGNQALALRLFATLTRASTDPGTSVRKSAIKILWESCIRAPGFPRATDACKHVLMRSGDPEESIQDMVAKVFHSLWFTPRLETGDDGCRAVERSATERAQQLADVALAVYEAGGRAIHLPLDQNHPLVAVLRAALGVGARGDLKKEWAAGREVANALLDLFLTAQEISQAGEQAGFKHLLSLHAFVVTDVELCMPPKDRFKFVRSLAPYLKVAPDATGVSEATRRRGAETLLCVLSVLEGVLSQLRHCEATTLVELLPDLHQLINRHPFVQVLAGACTCLTTLAAREEAAARQLATSAAVYASWLREPPANGAQQQQQQQAALLCRFLFILGQLCRRGADVLESTAPESGGAPLSMTECQHIFVRYCGGSQSNLKVAEAALGAIGALTIARPAVMVDKRSAANKIMKAALQPSAPELLKLKALSNLIELLRADEAHMMAAQADGGTEGGGKSGGLPGCTASAANGTSGGKRRGRKAAAAAAAEQAAGDAVLQTQNGEGDTLSQSSSILQGNWEAVLQLATDTTPSPPGSALSPPSSAGGADLAPGTHVRRRVVEMMEVVMRGGLVGPWTAVAPLMALATDPLEDIRGRALRLLRQLCDKYPRYLDSDRLCSGVVQAFSFRAALSEATGETRRGWADGAPPQALAGLSAVYTHLIQPKFQLRMDFLRGVLKRLRSGACLVSSGAAEADMRLLAFCAALVAGLPYKRGDEPCMVVQEINAILCRSGEGVREELKRSLYGSAAPAAPAAMEEDGACVSPATAAAGAATRGVPPSPSGAAPSSAVVMAQCKASLALSMLLLVKEYLKTAYSINSERIVAFSTAGEKRKAEEKVVVTALQGVHTHLDKLNLEAQRDPAKLREQYKLFKQLLKRDAADYGHLVAGGGGRKGQGGGSEEPEAPGSGDGGPDGGVLSPGGEPGDDVTPGWMEGLGQAPAGTARGGRGRGGLGGRRGRSAGRGGGRGAATTGGRGRKKRKAQLDSGTEDESEGSDQEYEPRPRTHSTRKLSKRLPMTH